MESGGNYITLEHPDCTSKTYTLKLSDGLVVTYITTEFRPRRMPTNSICKSINNAIKSLVEKGWTIKKEI